MHFKVFNQLQVDNRCMSYLEEVVDASTAEYTVQVGEGGVGRSPGYVVLLLLKVARDLESTLVVLAK